MQLLNRNVHLVIRDHPVLRAIRKLSRRGNEVIVYRHRRTGQFILAEQNGRATREIATLPGWPRLGQLKMRGIVRQLNPLPRTQLAKMKMILKTMDRKKECSRDLGRFRREMQARFKSVAKRSQRDHPDLNWPKIRGEGV